MEDENRTIEKEKMDQIQKVFGISKNVLVKALRDLNDILMKFGVVDVTRQCVYFYHLTSDSIRISISRPISWEYTNMFGVTTYEPKDFLVDMDKSHKTAETIISFQTLKLLIAETDEIAKLEERIRPNGQRIKSNRLKNVEAKIYVEKFFNNILFFYIPTDYETEYALSMFDRPERLMVFYEPVFEIFAICLKDVWPFAKKYQEIALASLSENNHIDTWAMSEDDRMRLVKFYMELASKEWEASRGEMH